MMVHRTQTNNLLLFPIISFKLLKLVEMTLGGTVFNEANLNESHVINEANLNESHVINDDTHRNETALIALCKGGHSEPVRVCSFPYQPETWRIAHTYSRVFIFHFNSTVFKVSLETHQINLPDAIIAYKTSVYNEVPISREEIARGLNVLYKGNIVVLEYSLPFSAEWDGVNFKGKTFVLSVYFELLCSNKLDPNFYQTDSCFDCIASCADTKSTQKQHNSTATDQQDLFDAYTKYPELAYSHTLFSAKTKLHRKHRQVASFPPTPVSCVLHLVADHLFYKYVGDGSVLKTINVLFRVVNDADALFRSTDFDGDQHGDNVGFIIGKVTIFPDGRDPNYNFSQPYLTADGYLKLFSFHDFSDYCLGVAFTYREFYGLAGSSFQAYSDQSLPGGICQERLRHNLDIISFNTALITFLNFGQKLKESQIVLIIAHELGHSFGASHDVTEECHSELADGHFLMSAKINSGTLSNNARFSACSVRSMLPVIQKKGSCLLYNKQISQCGNSVTELGEECDCGSREICSLIDPCCTPADEKGLDKPCTVRRSTGKLCSPKVHPCCTDSCNYTSLSDHRLCSQLHYCSPHSVCDGLSGHCPFRGSLPDGTLCNSGFQVCSRGSCSQAACEYHNLSTCICREFSHQCKLCCMDSRTSLCEPASSYGIVTSVGEILQQPGELCSSNGFCDSSMKCLTPLNIVVKNDDVLGFTTSLELKVHLKKYWLYYTCAAFGLVFTILVLLIPYKLDDNRYMKALRYGKMLAVFDAGEYQIKLYKKTLQDIDEHYKLAIRRREETLEPKDYIEAMGRLKLFFPGVHISYLSRVAKLSASESIAIKMLLLQGFKMSTFSVTKPSSMAEG